MSPREPAAGVEPSRISALDVPALARTSQSDARSTPNMTAERVKTKGIEIEMRFSGEPTAETYRFLKKYIDLRIEDLADGNGKETGAEANPT